MAGNPLIFIGGLAAAVGIGYYLHQGGYFNKIFDAINDAIGQVGKTPSPAGGCSSGKIKCKDGKCNTQANCNKQANCKAPKYWSASEKKCITQAGASLAMAYNTPHFWSSGSHRGYLLNSY